MKRYAMALALLLAGCGADGESWLMRGTQAYGALQREHEAQRRTTDRLTMGCRECLTAGVEARLCCADLLIYRACLSAGDSDAECRPGGR